VTLAAASSISQPHLRFLHFVYISPRSLLYLPPLTLIFHTHTHSPALQNLRKFMLIVDVTFKDESARMIASTLGWSHLKGMPLVNRALGGKSPFGGARYSTAALLAQLDPPVMDRMKYFLRYELQLYGTSLRGGWLLLLVSSCPVPLSSIPPDLANPPIATSLRLSPPITSLVSLISLTSLTHSLRRIRNVSDARSLSLSQRLFTKKI
jgi:hypothetical protein